MWVLAFRKRLFTGGRKEKTYFGEQGTAQAVRELTGARPAERTPGRRKKDSAEEQMTLWTQAPAPEGETSGEVPARKKKIKVQKQPFTVTSMRAAQFRPTDMCLATELAVELNRLADLQTVQKLSGAEIMRYAAAQDWVREVYREGRWGQTVTESGDRAGFFLDTRVSQHGTQYQVVYLSAAAQQAVLDYYTDRIVLPGGEA